MADAAYAAWRQDVARGAVPSCRPSVLKQFDVQSEDAGDRRIRFTVTTSTPDRERDVVLPNGIDFASFKKNPVITWAHDYKIPPIGRAVSIEMIPNGVRMVIEFATADLNPLADQVFRMIKAGFINATSIGFRPLEWTYNEERGGVDFLRIELLETAVVPVPANAEALIAAGLGVDTEVLKEWAERTLEAIRSREAPAKMTDTEVATDEPMRWNRSLSKAFDVAREQFQPATSELQLVKGYMDVDLKLIERRVARVPAARLGSTLTAIDLVLRNWQTDDVRKLTYDGKEVPPQHDRIQLNSTQANSFLVDGIRFLRQGETRTALSVEPQWYGMAVVAYGIQRSGTAGDLLGSIAEQAAGLNFLKGEAFSLGGEFLPKTAEAWDDLFLSAENTKTLQRVVDLVNEKGAALENRGVLLCGPPGTGKTLAGRIMRNTAQATFVWVSARDFYYSGAFGGFTEAFDISRECAPTILFVEDVDNWLDSRSIDLLKTEMDGIKQSSGVVTILTTNFPEQLPKALIDRPGRFHDVLRIGHPDADARARMLAKWLPELDTTERDAVVAATDNYSGAHMRELVRFARVIGDEEHMEVGAAVQRALAKIVEQRQLVTDVQSAGSRYRAPQFVALTQKAVALHQLSPDPLRARAASYVRGLGAVRALARLHEQVATYGEVFADGVRAEVLGRWPTAGAPPFERDAVGWKAVEKAVAKLTRRAGTPLTDAQLAEVYEDYGFDAEAAVLREVSETEVDELPARLERILLVCDDDGVEAHMRTLVDALRKAGARHSRTDQQMLQDLHDLSTSLGAVCAMAEEDETKEIPAAGGAAVLLLAEDDEVPAPETAEAELVLVLDETADPLDDETLDIDADALTAAIRDELAQSVARETRVVINAMRGRI